ncbi:succinyl-diaminopimelate desuccinylase [Aeromicrobium sp. CTD01-1L150]|uniref:succinyl-diaminopimelate desuccinylase n=1 Tax=Aeromicrobium sp. CTD01-1L150 TaxID=3341830 RepID=UPI0035C17DD6
MAHLDPTRDIVTLTADLVDVASESFGEQELADAVEQVLQDQAHLDVTRDGHTLVARTSLGRAERVVIAGHLDTVPANDNFPSRLEGDVLWGLGSCDMKGGVAVALKLAATVAEPVRDVTYVLYEAEEVAAVHNGLGRIAREQPDLLAADFAILMEPSDAGVEAGCQGTMRIDVMARGERAHSARSWRGSNAIHAVSPVLAKLAAYEPRRVVIDGLEYREGLNAVGISGGVAGNVVPDEACVSINYRFAPDLTEEQALAHLHELFGEYEIVVTDTAPGALPGLERPAAAAFIEAIGATPRPKFGWTDVAQFTQLGVPAVNYGPGDPLYAHKQDEHVSTAQLVAVEDALRRWLSP